MLIAVILGLSLIDLSAAFELFISSFPSFQKLS